MPLLREFSGPPRVSNRKRGGAAPVIGWILTMTGASSNFKTLNFNSSGNIFGAGSTAGSPNTDAFLSQFTTDGTVSAKKALSGSDYEAFKSVVVDSSGNIHAFGYNIPTGVGQGQALVMKLNSSYSITWQKKFEFSSNPNDEDIATGGIDNSGNVYFASGYYDTSLNKRNVMVFKLNSSGTVNWATRLLLGRDTSIRYAYVDSSGNTYTNITDSHNPGVGSYRQTTVKLDGSGAIAWQRTIYRTPANENVNAGEGQSIYADASGNVYVVGRCQVSSTNGGFVAKYNSSGTLQWNVEVGNVSIQLEGITADSSGNVYVTGNNQSTDRILILKFNSSGSLQWQRQLYWSGGAGVSTRASGINVSGDFVYIGGEIYSSPIGALAAKLKTDGSGTGTVGNWTYDASTLSTSTSTLTEGVGGFTASTLTAYSTADTSLTLADRSLTDTLVTL